MKLHIEQSGGVAGIRRRKSIDTEELASSQQKVLKRLVEACERLESTKESSASGAADYYHYRITVVEPESGRPVRQFHVDESKAPHEFLDRLDEAMALGFAKASPEPKREAAGGRQSLSKRRRSR